MRAIVAKLIKRGARLSPLEGDQTQDALAAVRANLRSAASVFVTGDRRGARLLSQQKAEFRRREAEAVRTHFARLRETRSPGPEASPLDLLRGVKRINDHLVAGAAYPVLEAAGELMPSRISDDGDPAP